MTDALRAPRLRGLSPAIAAYLILCAALLSNRLLSVLHAESSAMVAFVAFFVAGWHTLSDRPANRSLPLLGRHLLLLTIPWALLTLSAAWVPNCAYVTGLVLYVAFTVPSVVLGFALAIAITRWIVRWRRTLFVLVGLGLAFGGTLYDLGLHPQFFTLNHVYGGVLGPVYEEALYLRPGLFAFRALTLLWALVLLAASGRAPGPDPIWGRLSARRPVVLGLAAICIGTIYLFAPRLGINTPSSYLREALGGHLQTEHFDLYYDPQSVTEESIQALAEDHEYRFDWLRRRLGVAPNERIQSYLYPTVEGKLRLTGAGLTDVSPVWLRQPQMHLLLNSYPETAGHELVHVFSREFGLPVIRASWLVGLVEGLAVAMEPPDGRPGPREQVSVALQRAERADVGMRADPRRAVIDLMSPASFWSSRGAVSYSVAGSFVAYLIEAYGIERFRSVYPSGRFESVYGRSLPALADEWADFVRSIPLVSRAADDLVMRRFTVPSLFEKECPHNQPAHVARYRQAVDRLALFDTLGAEAALEAALANHPNFGHALARWSSIQLARGDFSAVLERVRLVPDSLHSFALHVYHGDALALGGDSTNAMRQYSAALDLLPLDERDARMMVLARALGGGRAAVAASFHGRSADTSGYSSDSSAVAAARRVGQALESAEAGAFGAASSLMADWVVPEEASVTPADRAFMQRMAMAWAGAWARRAGNVLEAERLLTAARQAALVVGDRPHVAELDDTLDKTAWSAKQPRNQGMALFKAGGVSARSVYAEVACR